MPPLSIQRLRERLPLVVFILFFILLVMVIGFACMCATHPMQALDRATSVGAAMPAVVEMWAYTVVALLVGAFVLPQRRPAFGRASPAVLQRFLF